MSRHEPERSAFWRSAQVRWYLSLLRVWEWVKGSLTGNLTGGKEGKGYVYRRKKKKKKKIYIYCQGVNTPTLLLPILLTIYREYLIPAFHRMGSRIS